MVANVSKSGGSLVDIVKTVVWALVIASVFRALLFQPFWIPSGSMKDTLLIGDFLFVNKMAYGYSRYSCPFISPSFSLCPITGRIFGGKPKRGDVVVFRHPVQNVDLIKRLIGLPGDRIQVVGGRLYINGAMVAVKGAGQFHEIKNPQGTEGHAPSCTNDPVAPGGDCVTVRRTETLPGNTPDDASVSHDILKITDAGMPNNTPVYTVPEGEYFFMGDNRDDSEDSRFPQEDGGVGFVPVQNIIGRADWILFSSAGRSLLYFWDWRADRFFRAVH